MRDSKKAKEEKRKLLNMDCFGVKKKSSNTREKYLRGLTEKVRLLQEDIKALMSERENESRAYERDMMVLEFEEANWKQESKRLKQEAKRLRTMLEDKEKRIRDMEERRVEEKSEQNCSFSRMGSAFLVKQMEEERVWRDEAVHKWKKLYLAIKTELDDLIQRTHHGNGLYWKAEEEEVIEELKMEVKAKEETIEELKARIAAVAHEEYKRAREVDILRQSLRIMSSMKDASRFDLNKPKSTLVKRASKA